HASRGEARTRDRLHRRVQMGVGARLRLRLRDGRRLLTRSAAPHGLPHRHPGRRPGPRLSLPGGEGHGRQLADGPADAIVRGQHLRPLVHGTQDLGPDGWVQVLSQAGTRGDRPVPGRIQWVRLPDRNERPRMAKRVQAPGNPDRVRRSDRGPKQDEQGHRTRGGLEGPAPATHGVVRPHLIGLPIYKMTGSGNDFVMLDARTSAPNDWNAADIQAVCARGTGIGADGIVFVGPGSQPGAARMIYYNADGSQAAMCGNAALCSTTLAVHLGLGSPDGMHLETDAGTYRSRT